MTILIRFYTRILTTYFRLPDLGYWLTLGVSGQQWMLTPPTHLISPLVYPGVRVCLVLIFF